MTAQQAPMSVTTCVDCGTTILGNRLRCPRCHEEHARELAAEDVTAPRLKHSRSQDPLQIMLAWFVLAEAAAAICLLVALAMGSC